MDSTGYLIEFVSFVYFAFLFWVGTPLIARRKHRSVIGWALAAILTGPFAFTLVLLLPALPDAEALAVTRACPQCLSSVPLQAKVCRYCQRDLPALDLTRSDTWGRTRLQDEELRDKLRRQITP